MAKRVFKNEIGKWPKVYQTAPGAFEVVATHYDPKLIKRMIWISRVPSFLLALYLLPRMNANNWGFIIPGGLIACVALFLILRNILTGLPFLVKSTARIRFENGRIKWGKQVVQADMARQFRTERHRQGAAEQRRIMNADTKTVMPFYQFSSEVFIDTGAGWMHNRQVAEIAKDENLEWGHLLGATLRLVDSRSQVHAETVQREGTRVDLD